MNNSHHDIKLIIPKGCDNAPRKQIVIDFTVAIWQQQTEILQEYAGASMVWEQLKDDKTIEGIHAFIEFLEEAHTDLPASLEIYQVITHGKFASINGVITLTDGTTSAFCDVYTFTNAAKSGKVKEVKSYRLSHK